MADLGLGMVLLVVGIGVLVISVAGYLIAYLAFLRKAGPNEVIVVSGRGRVKFITAGLAEFTPSPDEPEFDIALFGWSL